MTGLASRLRGLVSGREGAPVTYRLTRRVFLALLGVVYAIAFGSIWVQVQGLVGSQGIAPAAEFLERARAALGAGVWWQVPSVLLANASDSALHVLCGAGVALALLVVLGIAPLPSLAGLWVAYLSIISVGDVFLGYQWDALLLETGLLAMFFTPRGLRPDWHAGQPPRVVLFLLRWLLFRLMFLSGAGKLLSGDTAWAELTALEYHYWTQPLPHVLSHYVHHLPAWWHRCSTIVMFVIEVGAPFLVFGPRRLRQLAGLSFLGLMATIVATGNYGFFEPLTCVLCVTLFDDRALRSVLPTRFRGWHAQEPEQQPPAISKWRGLTAVPVAFVIVLTTLPALRRLGVIDSVPTVLRPLVRVAAPFHSFNSYGLFTVMTTERPEIVIEGSRDGREWLAYEFRYKPGALDRAPRFAWAHMPRLDWQLWFAALQDWRNNPWYLAFVQKLLAGEPAVLRLLARNPFPDEPPRYVRSTRWRYTFSSPEERARGQWWRRADAEPYCPTLAIVDGRLAPAR